MITCESCKFFVLNDDEGGDCKRYPPQTLGNQPGLVWSPTEKKNREVQIAIWRFPSVLKDDWCGEYSERKEKDD